MDNVDLFELGTMTNSSPAMFERRRRILHEARRMIGKSGLESFSIRELCSRADVSTKTIYNAFGSKENVIALAIKNYFEVFHERMRFEADAPTFEGALERQIATTLRNRQIPNYLQVVATLYFSPTLNPQIHAVLLDIGTRSWMPWIQSLRISRQLERWVDLKQLASDISDIQFAKVHQWRATTLADASFLNASVTSVLTHLSGAAKGPARSMARTTLAEVRDDATAWSDRVVAVGRRLDESLRPVETGQH